MSELVGLVFLIIILVISITGHEFMHGFVAYKLGDDTARASGRLTLNPLAHIDPFLTVLMPIILYFLTGFPIGAAKPVPFNPSRLRNGETGMAMVGAAGPLTNLVLAIFIAAWIRVVPMTTLVRQFFELFVLVNVGFFTFNLIPFPPLDGSRVLYALVPEPVRGVMRQIESFGIFGIILFIVLLFPLISPLLGTIIGGLIKLLVPDFSLIDL